jgi:hypothetical protein
MPTQPSYVHPDVQTFIETYSGENGFVLAQQSRVASGVRLSQSQVAVVERIMVEHGWTVARGLGDVADTWTAPLMAAVQAGTPASHNDATSIRNGTYTVTLYEDDVTHVYKIFTIRRTQNDGLRYKRVISCDGTTLGYLTTQGRFRIWRRHSAMENSTEVRLLNVLLLQLRLNGEPLPTRTAVTLHEDHNRYFIEVFQYECRYCGHSMSDYTFRRLGHDDCTTRRTHDSSYMPPGGMSVGAYNNLADRYAPLSMQREPDSSHSVPLSASRARVNLSELGTGWEQ